MKNYLISISYDGSAYKGWQRLADNDNTIQNIIEQAILTLAKEKVHLIASGRTDAGVHAICQLANFKCKYLDEDTFIQNINEILPKDIRINSIELVNKDFHCRYDIKRKRYIYRMHYGEVRDVFLRKYVYEIEKPDIELMRNVAKKLIGEHDFRGFSSEKNMDKSTIRTLYSIDITDNDGYVDICFEGNGFLYNMVRIIAGTILMIGQSKLNIDIIDEIFATKRRELAGETLPGYALFVDLK